MEASPASGVKDRATGENSLSGDKAALAAAMDDVQPTAVNGANPDVVSDKSHLVTPTEQLTFLL